MQRPPNVIITACAGSGKTHDLIERLFALLEVGVNPGDILAITFTKKAAAEIGERLLIKLQAKAAAGVTWAASCHRRMILAEKAEDCFNVHTFHSWFNVLLAGKRWSPGWYGPAQLLESEMAIRERAWHQWLMTVEAEKPPELVTVLSYCSPTTIKKTLFHFASHINAWRLYAAHTTQITPLSHPPMQSINQDLQQALTAFIEQADGTGKAFATAQAAAENFLSSQADADFESLQAAFFTQSGVYGIRAALRKDAEKNNYQALLEAVASAITARQVAIETSKAYTFNEAMMELATAFVATLETIKNDKNVMSFDDLEYEAYQMVKENGAVNPQLYRLNRRFRHILIDEFQDTSPLQWQIIRLWLEAVHGTDDAPSVFIIGDSKQAIYRFRHGDARVLAAARQFFQQYYDDDNKMEEKAICRRCAPPILQVVNAVFSGNMEDFRRHTVAPSANGSLVGRVEWHPATAKPPSQQRRNPRNPLLTARASQITQRQQWAERIVKRLKHIINHWNIEDEDNPGNQRPCRASDILLLLPQSTHAASLAQAMGQQGLACSIQGGGVNIFHSFACQDALALLTVLMVPANSLSLASVLKSPLFAFSDNLLLSIAIVEGNDLWTDLMNDKRPETARARELLSRWRAWLRRGDLPVHDLLTKIFSDGEVVPRYRAAVAPAYRHQVSTDLHALLDFSLSNDGGERPLCQQFLQAAQRAREAGSMDRLPHQQGIRLSTVHKAKGLEAAVVIIADMTFEQQYSGGRSSAIDLLIDWPPEQESPKTFCFCPRVFRYVLRQERQKDEEKREREYNNLLYVAMTRAKQALLIFSANNSQSERAQWLSDAMATGTTAADEMWVVGQSLEAAREDEVDQTAVALPPTHSAIGTVQEAAAIQYGEELHQLIALLLAGLSEEEALTVCRPTNPTVFAAAKQLLAVDSLQALLQSGTRFFIEPEFMVEHQLVRLDLLIVNADRIWIIDYKSGGNLHRYRRQMENYKKAVGFVYPDKMIDAALLSANGHFETV